MFRLRRLMHRPSYFGIANDNTNTGVSANENLISGMNLPKA